MKISSFQWTVQVIKTQKFFVTKTIKLCSIILVRKIIEFYRYTENEKSNTFSALFNKVQIYQSVEVSKSTLGKTMKKDKKSLTDRFHHL